MEGEAKEKRERENYKSENQNFVKEENKGQKLQKSKQTRRTVHLLVQKVIHSKC